MNAVPVQQPNSFVLGTRCLPVLGVSRGSHADVCTFARGRVLSLRWPCPGCEQSEGRGSVSLLFSRPSALS